MNKAFELNKKLIISTVDPDNFASMYSFIKSGFKIASTLDINIESKSYFRNIMYIAIENSKSISTAM